MSAEAIGKNSKITVELLIAIIGLTALIVGSVIRAEMNNETAKASIVDLRQDLTKEIANLNGQFTAYAASNSADLKAQTDTLNKMLVEARIKNELDAVRMGDRWTAGMMDTRSDDIYDIMKKYHPELTREDFKSIKTIQRDALERMYFNGNGGH